MGGAQAPTPVYPSNSCNRCASVAASTACATPARRGAAHTASGKCASSTNRGTKRLALDERDFAPRDTLAVALAGAALDPAASTTAFVVGTNEGDDHD